MLHMLHEPFHAVPSDKVMPGTTWECTHSYDIIILNLASWLKHFTGCSWIFIDNV